MIKNQHERQWKRWGGRGKGTGVEARDIFYLNAFTVRKGIILHIKLQLGNHANSLIFVKRTIVTDQINP